MTDHTPAMARTVRDIRALVDAWHANDETVALVPTMGALHAGHLSLIDYVKPHADRTVVSIFVNPTQFAAHEDLGTYPRDEAGDLAKLAPHNVDAVYAPTADEMYPDGFSTHIAVDGISEGLCGASRPHFFGGVATVVAKLFLQCRPDVAVFGEKDYQQLLVIRRMVRDLDLPINVLGAPIVREEDGLAMSSRNAYLGDEERAIAPRLYQALTTLADELHAGAPVATQIDSARQSLENAGFKVDYLELRHAETLASLDTLQNAPGRLFVAAYLGNTRLIDNIAVR